MGHSKQLTAQISMAVSGGVGKAGPTKRSNLFDESREKRVENLHSRHRLVVLDSQFRDILNTRRGAFWILTSIDEKW